MFLFPKQMRPPARTIDPRRRPPSTSVSRILTAVCYVLLRKLHFLPGDLCHDG